MSEERPDSPRNGRREIKPESVGFPIRPFLYTLDQVAYLMGMAEITLRSNGTIHYEGRSTGTAKPTQMKARNIAQPESTPDWRVAEQEILRWMKNRGFKIYNRTWASE